VPDVFKIIISFSGSSLTLILGEVLYVSFGLHTNRMPTNTLLHLIPNLLFLTAVLNSGCYRLALSEIMHKSLHYLCLSPGPDSVVAIPTKLQAGQSGHRIPVGETFSLPIQISPGIYLASYTIVLGLFPRGEAAGMWH